MTKVENEKCKKLMYDAIRKASNAKEDYKVHERLLKDGKKVDAECKLRAADQKIGYTEGINQTLCILGFKHEDMKTLADLL